MQTRQYYFVPVLTQLFCFACILTDAIFTPVRLKNSDHYVQIGDREPYNAHLTSLSFAKPICVIALDVQTLQPLTGAEDIEITYSICDEASKTANSSWTLAHYTNKKNVFVLRKPILTRRLAIVAGIGRGTTAAASSVLNVNIKQCDSDVVFGPEGTEKLIAKSESICPISTNPSKHHTHRHRHNTGNVILRVDDMALDQLLPTNSAAYNADSPFKRSKRSTNIETPSNKAKRQVNFVAGGECPPGYAGQTCTEIDCRAVRNCSNSGICIAPNTCQCAANYFGPDCSQCSGWFCNQCDFYCVHGQCDAATRSCSCRPGWSGAACDICLNGTNCEVFPTVALILPQTAEINNQNDYVFVHGRDFPQGDGRYHCLFGGISTAGNWLSSDLVRCAVPRRARAGKHVFNVIPFGAANYLPNIQGKVQHFTFYPPCIPESCHGSCLGPLCMCNSTVSGDDCNSLITKPTRRDEILSDSSITFAQEGEPYVISMPIDATSRIAEIDSEIASELIADPFKHTLTWEHPRGRSKPYEIAVNVVDDNMDVGIRWNLTVNPSYTVIAGKLEPQTTDNSWVLKGFVEAANGSWVSPTVPIKLEILSSKQPNIIFDTINTTSTNSTSFQRPMYPYAGVSTASETYTIRAKHPGQSDDAMTNCATWKYKKLQVTSLDGGNITINNGSHALGSFATNSLDLNCRTFEVFVVTPTRIVQIIAWSFLKQNVGRIETTFIVAADGTPNRELRTPVDAIIGFSCGKSIGATVKVRFIPSTMAVNNIQANPESIFVYSNQLTTLEIVFANVKTEIAPGLVTATNILPFYIVASSPQTYGNANVYRNGSTLKLTLGVFSGDRTGVLNGVIQLPSAAEPLIEIPYSIRPPAAETLELIIMPLGFVAPQPAKDYPLEVALYSVNGAVSLKRIVYLNVRSEFYPLPPDFYRISIRSLAFQSFDTIHNLRPENNTLTLFLHRKPTNLAVSDGQEIKIEAFPLSSSDSTVEPVAEVVFQPSHFTASELDKEIYIDVVYSQGPYNSTAFIDFNKAPSHTSQFYLTAIDNEGETLCVGCGLRQRIRISKNPNFINPNGSNCSVFRGSVPFHYVVDGVAMDFKSEAVYILDLRKTRYDKVEICQSDSNTSPLPEVTTVLFDCAAARLAECRRYYVPVQSCGSAWKQIPDDVLSIHVYALFLKMQQTCANNGVDFQQFATLIDCINTLDADCPVTRPLPATESSAPTTQSPFVSMLNQINAIKPLTQPLSGFFPALSTVESQLVNLPSQMGDFIHAFQRVFPTFTPSKNSTEWFDAFWKVIDDNSPGGPSILESEAAKLPNWPEGSEILTRWNKTNKLMTGENPNMSKNSEVNALRRLTESADRLKGLARQFGAANPFEMFYEVQTGLFSRTSYSPNASQPVARVLGTVEPGNLREKDEFDVSVVITNVMNTAIQNIKLQLEILQTSQNQPNLTRITYRIGPLFYSGGTPDRLNPGSTLTATWKVQPIFERRLSKSINIKPNVILFFDLANRRRIQRLGVPTITIKPQRHLRVFALAYPTVDSQTIPNDQPFSMALYVMNSGFSDLRNIRFPLLTPQLLRTTDSKPIEYHINSVSVDGKFAAYTPDVVIPRLPSGRSTVISINISTLGNEVANFINCTVAVTVDDDLLDFLDYRFYRIKEAVNNDGYVISDGDPMDDRSITYHFDTKTTKINALHNVQLVEKTESHESTPDGATSLVTTATFQRLLDQNQLAELANPTSLQQMTSTIIGKIQYPEDSMPPNYELVRLTEMASNGERRHTIPLENTWITPAGETKELNFVDEEALPPALASQLHYEFVFGRRAEFNAPFFSQNAYAVQIYPEMIPEDNIVVGKVDAVSPVGQKLEYDLVGTDEEAVKAFAIGKKSGEIILTSDELPASRPSKSAICFNVVAKDENGRQTVTPMLIQLPVDGMNLTSDTYCNVFSSSTPVKHHQFDGDRTELKQMRFVALPSTTEMPDLGGSTDGKTSSTKETASGLSTANTEESGTNEIESTTSEFMTSATGMENHVLTNTPAETQTTTQSTQNQTTLASTSPTVEASSTDLPEASLPSTMSSDFTTDPKLIAQLASEATYTNEVNGWKLITPAPGLTEPETTDLGSWERPSDWQSTSEGVVLPQYPDDGSQTVTHLVDGTITTAMPSVSGVSSPEYATTGVILPSTATGVEEFESTVTSGSVGQLGVGQLGGGVTTDATSVTDNEGTSNDRFDATTVRPAGDTTNSWQTSARSDSTETLFPDVTEATRTTTIPSTLITYPDTLPHSQMTNAEPVEASWTTPRWALSTIGEMTTVEAFTLPPTVPESETPNSLTQNPLPNQPLPTPSLILPQTPSPPPISPLPAGVNDISTIPIFSITAPPPTQPLPIASGGNISENRASSSMNQAGLMSVGSEADIIQNHNSNSMTKIACRLRDTKPIWAIICDMSKTVSVGNG